MTIFESTAVRRAEMVLSEVRSAAKWCARRGYKGVRGDPLPNLLSSRAATWINNNPRAFREMVKQENNDD